MKKMIPIGETPRVSKVLVFLCGVAAVLAVAISVVSVISYTRSAREKKELQREVTTLTAQYNKIKKDNEIFSSLNTDLQGMVDAANADQKDIGKTEKRLSDAADYNQRNEKLKKEIEKLTKEVEELKAQFPEGYFDMDEEE